MINLINAVKGNKKDFDTLYQMKFDSKAACENQPINTQSFKVSFDKELSAIKLTSVTNVKSDIGFTVNNKPDKQGENDRREFVETMKKARFAVVTYKNDSDHKYFAFKLARRDVSLEIVNKSSGNDAFYSVIIPTPEGACFRDFVDRNPNNTAIFPFWTVAFKKNAYRVGDDFYIKHFTYFTDEDSAYAYCDSLLGSGEIAGYHFGESLAPKALELADDIISEKTKQYVKNAEKGIFPEPPARRAPYEGKLLKKVPDGLVAELDKRFEERKEAILKSPSEWTLGKGGKIIYVSVSGDDNNDGLSEKTPKRTIASISNGLLVPGDVALLKRGDMWHETLVFSPGITYSAYGEGKKPELRASVDGVGKEKWIECDRPGLYRFAEPLGYDKDVGNIVFNDGEYYGARVVKYVCGDDKRDARARTGDEGLASNGKEYWYTDLEPMEGPEVLRHRLEYYHDYENMTLYLFSPDGNPGEIYDMLEISVRGHVAMGRADGVTLDNLCLRFTGVHGIGAASSQNFTVRNCEIGWIGGSLGTKDNIYARYGNGIEIFGGCDNYNSASIADLRYNGRADFQRVW